MIRDREHELAQVARRVRDLMLDDKRADAAALMEASAEDMEEALMVGVLVGAAANGGLRPLAPLDAAAEAEGLFESWVNGNRVYVIDRLLDPQLGRAQAARLLLCFYEVLRARSGVGARDRELLAHFLEAEKIEEEG